MMNINKSTSSLPNNPANSFFLNQSNTQPMKVMTTNVNNNMNQFGPSFSNTTTTTAASATSNSAAGMNPGMNPQLPFQSQHSIFSSSAGSGGGGIGSGGVSTTTPLEDPNINSNSGFDFLSMNPFSNPTDPFQLTSTTSQQHQSSGIGAGAGGGGGGGGVGAINQSTTAGINSLLNPPTSNFNRERRLSSIFDIENSRDSLEGGIGLFGSNNVFNANKEDSCFSFGDNASISDKKNDLGEYDHSLFSFMEQRRYSKVMDTNPAAPPLPSNQKTVDQQFPLPPLSSPLLGNVNNENEFKFPSRDLLDESSKISFVSNAKSSSLTCKSSNSHPNNTTNQGNISFNEIYNNPFNYEALNSNNQTTMQKLLNMQQIILNNQERIQQNAFIDNTNLLQSKQQQQQPPDQLVWNSIMNAQRTNERFLAENLFNTQNQMFNQNAFLNKENPLLEKHVPLNTIAVQSHSLNNAPRSNEANIGFMNQGYQFATNSQKSNEKHNRSLIPQQQAIVNNHHDDSPNNSKNKKKRKAKDVHPPEKKKKIKSQGHSSESQLSNQEIILASSSQFELDEGSNQKIAAEDSNMALLDNDSNNSSDSNQKKFCFRNLIVEKSSKKMKFVNSDIKEEGTNQGAWSEREHQAFLKGLKDLGYGKWREIADRYVKTRTRIQVASHSQKYHQRLERHAKKKKKLQKNSTPQQQQQQQQEDDVILQHDTINSED